RDDLAGLRVDGGAAGPHVGVDLAVLLVEAVHQLVVDGVDEGVLLVLLQRGGDAVAAPVEFVLADDPVLDEVVLDGADDVAALAGHAGGDGGLLRHGELHAGPLRLAEPALLDHAVQDVVPAGLGGLAVLRVGDHVVLAGRVDERGEVGGAAGVEVLGVHAVVGLGGGLDAVGVAAEVTGVEVALEDLVLALLPVQLDGDEELLHLAGDGLLLAQVVVLHVLLGDGGAGLLALAGGRVPGGADHRFGVDGGLGVEVPVLGGEDRVPGGLGDAVEGDVLPVDLAVPGDDGAVGVQVDVGLLGRQGVGGRDLHQVVAEEEGPDQQQGADDEGAEHHPPGGDQTAPAGAPALAPRRALRGVGRLWLSRGPARARLWLRLVAHVVHGLLFRLVRRCTPGALLLLKTVASGDQFPADAARPHRMRLLTRMARSGAGRRAGRRSFRRSRRPETTRRLTGMTDDAAPDLRASDTDRERVADSLRDALAEGRLDMEEFGERLDATYRARTYGELAPITRDLPSAGVSAPAVSLTKEPVPSDDW